MEIIFLQKLQELSEKIDHLSMALKHDNQIQSEWMDKEEVLRTLKCSERSLQTLRDNGSLRYSNPLGGSKYFYRREDIEALFKKNFNGNT